MMLYLERLLGFFAEKIIKKYQPRVIGITGSVGKTTTKEAVAMVLSENRSVRKSYKNYNNALGVPLTIIGAKESPGKSLIGWLFVFAKAVKLLVWHDASYPKILVLEMGADRPGDIPYLVSIAPCEVGVLTAIAHAHTEFFGDLEKIAQEKRAILTQLSKDGLGVVNGDSQLVRAQVAFCSAHVVTYGLKEGVDFRAIEVKLITEDMGAPEAGLLFKVVRKGSVVPFFIPGVVGEHVVPQLLAAVAVGERFGVNLVEAAERLRHWHSLPGHMHLIKGIKKSLVIDDTYNSSPMAVAAALTTLKQIPVKGTAERYAVLGDMLELGSEMEAAHRQAGFAVAENGVDFLITVGECSKHTAIAAREAGLEEHRIASFADSYSAGRFLQEKIEFGDVVLVKGSQGLRMERVVKEIMAEPLRAHELLVRQEKSWNN